MSNYVKSANFYLSSFGCNTNTTSIPYARYSLTYLCATLIQDSSYSLPCNYQVNQSPPPLCQSTCFDFSSSIKQITNDTNLCPNQQQTSSRLDALNSSCQYWSGLNGTTDCIIGLANEPDYCGFDSIDQACGYCKSNSDDSCCQLVTCKHLSTGAIIGIIVGVLAFIGCIGATVYWFYFHNNKKHQKLYRSNHFDHDDSSSMLYDSQNVLHYNNTKSTSPPLINTSFPPTTITPPMDEFYQVKHPYPPQMGDELGLHVGDIVCVAMNFDDGWALGFNVTTGLKGVFPLVCVAPAPEELLQQLLQQTEQSTKILVEDDLQQICENIRRSISLSSNKNTNNPLPTSELTHHNSIPRRTASIMRRDYHDHDSPTSPTLHTPFFDTISQPEPVHQLIENIEMHQQSNKRVSKLQE